MALETLPYGATPAGPADLVVLSGERLELAVSTLGAAVQRLTARTGAGDRELVLGLPDAAGALADESYIGAVVGRFANRIARGELPLAGRTYALPVNDGPNTLHGGPDGFHRRVWRVAALSEDPVPALRLELVSPEGDAGFPGELTAAATYTVDGDRVRLELEATTSATTVVNLTNHAYFHLGAGGDVRDLALRVDAARYLPVDDTAIPTSGPTDVAGTPFDLRGGGVLRTHRDGLIDHCYVLDEPGLDAPQLVLRDPATGWGLELSTDAPGVQVYTGSQLRGAFRPHQALCLEPQWFPDTPHHEGEDGWPSTVLEPGATWRTTMVWRVVPPAEAQRDA
jgi:aldose 1-epimerase